MNIYAVILGSVSLSDLITGDENFGQVASLKDIAIKIFHEAGFNFLKWYSKVPTLVGKEYVHETAQLFAKHNNRV